VGVSALKILERLREEWGLHVKITPLSV